MNIVCIHKSTRAICRTTQEASMMCVWVCGGHCFQSLHLLPCEALQSQHSLGIGLSPRCVSFPQQLKQRPSSNKSWSARHTVQFHMLGPRQCRQDESHALQSDTPVLDSEPWSNRRKSASPSHIYLRAALPNRSYGSKVSKFLSPMCKVSCLSPVKWHRSLWDIEIHRCHP